MKILLVGEFSGLHNQLKKGLTSFQHEVVLINNGDSFKDYPADISIKAKFFKSKLGNITRQIWFRIFKYDLALLEHGIRFWWQLSKLKDFDVVQLINESPIQTHPRLEFYLLKKLFNQNKKIILVSCGIDSYQVQYMLDKKPKYSVMTPYFEDTKNSKQYEYYFEYLKPNFKKITDLIAQHTSGIIAADFDYIDALKNHPKYLGYIPYPIASTSTSSSESSSIKILLGINTGNAVKKGIPYFQEALKVIQKKYPEKVEILISQNLPYKDYQNYYQKADILLDQVYSFDQGYNALEAMLHKKVVFSGFETEFLKFYQLKEDEIGINAIPNIDYLVEKLSLLIENPNLIESIGNQAKIFVEEQHNIQLVAKKYIHFYKI